MPRDYVYSDIDMTFAMHPVKQDISLLKDEDAIIASVKNLVLTSKFETPFDPELGSNVRKLLFENWSPAADAMLAQLIAEVITNYEPRVELQQIDVTYDEETSGYYVTIHFLIKSIPGRVFKGSFAIDKSR
jgi:phage baseplate assembly protein W